MGSLIKRLVFGRQDKSKDGKDHPSSCGEELVTLDDEQDADWPYIVNSIFYLAIILFIGVPIWFYTCSSTRHALPDLSRLEDKVSPPGPRLHLDISVVQLAATPSHRDLDWERQSDYLRYMLPEQLETSIEGLTYNLNWRLRRPTQEESQLMKSILKETEPPTTNEQRQAIYTKIQSNLLRVHKSTNRFRLFMYIFDGPLRSLVCTEANTYFIDYERFIYICPGQDYESVADLIKSALHETYKESIDPQRIKKIIGAKTDLLVSLIPETDSISLQNLSSEADKVHKIIEKNVKIDDLKLAGILNIRLITQNIYLLPDDDALSKMIFKKGPSKTSQANSTDRSPNGAPRVLSTKEIGRFFHDYESRLNKHSSQSVHHVVLLIPDRSRPELVFNQNSETPVQILEERDTNFILLGNNDKSLVLGLRAIVRRVIGLRLTNLCKSCLIRRDVFLNKWEIDAIVGALTLVKLQSVLVSLRSISHQAIGIKIPKYVSKKAFEAHSLALKSLENLALGRPFEAYSSVSSAHELSETAYYDPSLLETLYFPDETKYAIYLPLFLPLAFPLALSAFRVAKYLLAGYLHLSGKRKEKTS